jgi:hemoglobin
MAGIGRADDGPSAKQIDAAIYQTINKGVAVYNAGDYAGCYRIYEGSLTGIAPLLASRPALKATIDKGLAEAEAIAGYPQKAFKLRGVLDDVRSSLTPLWTRLGGEPAVKAVVHAFVLKAAGDPNVDFTRGGKYQATPEFVANLEKLLVEQISSVSGGPLKYTGRDMKSSHAGMGITDAQFGAIAGDLIAVLKSFKVPDKEINELVGIIATTKPDIVEAAPAAPTTDPGSLWARLGGEPAVKAVVHAFVLKAAADPKVNFFRDGKYAPTPAFVANLEKLLVELISQVSGGPLKYTGRDMKSSHAGMGITDAQFGAIAADLIEVLKSFNVPQKEIDELVGIIATTKKDIVEN